MQDNVIIIDLNSPHDTDFILIDNGENIDEEVDNDLAPLADNCNTSDSDSGCSPSGGGGSGSSTNNHNELNNIQGGNTSQRYHVNKQQYDAIINANSPSKDNPFLTQNDQTAGGGNLYKIDGGDAFGSNFHDSEKQ